MGRFFCKNKFIKFLSGRSAYFFNRINATNLYMTCFVIKAFINIDAEMF
jgi:hypothetical protein